jgi:hypothetical protein
MITRSTVVTVKKRDGTVVSQSTARIVRVYDSPRCAGCNRYCRRTFIVGEPGKHQETVAICLRCIKGGSTTLRLSSDAYERLVASHAL